MRAEAFDALAQLTGAHGGPTLAAARMVLVQGARAADAAALHDVHPVNVRKAVQRMRQRAADVMAAAALLGAR